MSTTHCDVHGTPWKIVPAGVSKKPPFKPYPAFQACSVQGCDRRPPKAQFLDAPQNALGARTPQSPPAPLPGVAPTNKDRQIIAQVAMKLAVEWLKGSEVEESAVFAVAERFYLEMWHLADVNPVKFAWKRGSKQEPPPLEDEDLRF